MCLNCLRSGHFIPECKSNSTCKHCGKEHHTILHNSNKIQTNNANTLSNSNEQPNEIQSTNNSNSNSDSAANQSNVITNCTTSHKEILLGTAKIIVYDEFNNKHELRALLDSASQSNYITNRACNLLKFKKIPIKIKISGFNENTTSLNCKVNVTINSRINNYKSNLQFLVTDKITSPIPLMSFSPSYIDIPSGITLADPEYFKSNYVDMLLGAEIFFELLLNGKVKQNNSITLQNSELGWIISGPLPNYNTTRTISCVSMNQLHQDVERFWRTDEFICNKYNLSINDIYCETLFKQTTYRENDGKFVVSIPFKENFESMLGNSYEAALNRFLWLENKFLKNEKLKQMYTAFINEYIDMKHMTKSNLQDIQFLLPHHPVIRLDHDTTKLRVVFDGSCKLNKGLSVNEVQHVGPILQNELFYILLRFRTHTYVLVGDIEKMYRCIWVHPEQTKYQAIIWRENNTHELQYYRLNTVTYGLTSSPFLAIRCLQELAILNQNSFPIESNIIKNDFYVDDLVTGTNSIEQLKTIKFNLIQILQAAGSNL